MKYRTISGKIIEIYVKQGVCDLFEFIPIIREERKKEMGSYEKLGVGFIEKRKYKLIEKISIESNVNSEELIEFEVRVTFKEVRFYIIKSDSCVYLSINEIYQLLNDMNLYNDIDIIDKLTVFYKTTEKDQFVYKDKTYNFPKSPNFYDKYKIKIANSNLNISWNEFFILIFLIQEKSNYFWSIKKEETIPYNNGIIYLLITLLNCKENNNLLKELGWNYSTEEERYMDNVLSKPDRDEVSEEEYEENCKIVERKYYLTEDEMKSILKI